jgi:hypothetical protein
MKQVHTCRGNHDPKHAPHPYTVCPLCACQYCPRHWPVCPRIAWHPNHASTDTERGKRQRELDEASKRRTA